MPDTKRKPANIETAAADCLNWNHADVGASLKALLGYVEEEANKSIDWYWRNKKTKSLLSRWIQALVIVLTSAAAIVPIIGQSVPDKDALIRNPLWASLLVGLAAALMALDRSFGFSSGWARYVMTATNIRKLLEEFRLDWISLAGKSSPAPTPEQVSALIQRAKEFRIAVEGMVLQETKDWVTEFQTNLAQLEKGLTSQLAELKEQTEKAAQARATASQPGSIQLTVSNAVKADNAKFDVKLENSDGIVAEETVTGSATWVRLNLTPGHYRLTVSATAGGKQVGGIAAAIVKPGEITQAQISLPL